MLSYALKRIIRSWKLFAALILGMMLAATFFGGINVGADTIGQQALDQQLKSSPVDMKLQPNQGFGSVSQPSSSFTTVASTVTQVDGVTSAEVRGESRDINNFTLPAIKAITDVSTLYHHITVSAPGTLPTKPNQTLVSSTSPLAKDYRIGSIVKYDLGFINKRYTNGTTVNSQFNVSLTIVGFATLDSVAVNTLSPNSFFPSPLGGPLQFGSSDQQNIAIISWDQSYARLMDSAYQRVQASVYPLNGSYFFNINLGFQGHVDVYLDRARLISPFDVEGSSVRVAQVEAQVSNVASLQRFSSNDFLLGPLQNLAPTILSLRLMFTVFSVPVFFMAWYVGRTVSQASFNLRRREIGLLMTKGFSQTQLFRHFLVEALLVGLVAGVLGLVAAFTLNPYFIQVLSGSYQGTVTLTTDTAIITVIFALILTFLAIFSPARQAATMDPAKALREYVYIEETRPSRKRGAVLAFSLGLYKIILLVLGINFQNIGRSLFGVNFFLAVVLVVLAILDFGLTFLGPFLFLYGATQLSTGIALRFHRKFASLSRRFASDIATLASKSVFRNPRRVTSLVFLVALILGYSIWVVGDTASQQDFNVRQAELQVGSDLRVSNVANLTNAITMARQLRGWSNNITGATPEADFALDLGSAGNLQVKGVDPATWSQGAYFEPGWFSGDVDAILTTMKQNNQTIVLDRGVASYYNIPLGGRVIIQQNTNVTLQVIGFFGPDYSQTNFSPFGYSYFNPRGWSYVPLNLVLSHPSLFTVSSSVLVKAAQGIGFSDLSNSIQKAYSSITVATAQVATEGVGGIISNGVLNVLRLGTVFAGAAASIGVGAVTYVGFKEREKETTMIAVRGLSYRQILALLVTEVLPLVIFAVILATIVGLIVVRGDTLASSSLDTSYNTLLAPRRVIFPFWALSNILSIVGLMLLGVFIPAFAFARKNLSRMSRTVRFS